MIFVFSASRRARAIAFASRKSRMRTPLHRRTEEIGACLADPFANGEGGKRRYVHHPKRAQAAGVSTQCNFARRALRRQPVTLRAITSITGLLSAAGFSRQRRRT